MTSVETYKEEERRDQGYGRWDEQSGSFPDHEDSERKSGPSTAASSSL